MSEITVDLKVTDLDVVKEMMEELAYLRLFYKQTMYCFHNEIGDMKKDLKEWAEANGMKVPEGY